MKSGSSPGSGGARRPGGSRPGHALVTALRATAPEELRVRRFAQDDLGLGPLAAQYPSDAGDSSTRAVSGHEVVQTLEVAEDLARRRRLMDVGIRFRLELPGEEPAVRIRKLYGFLIHPEALGGAWRQHDLGTEHRISFRRSTEKLSAIVTTRG